MPESAGVLMTAEQQLVKVLIDQYAWLALPSLLALVTAKQAYPWFQKWFEKLCNKYPTVKRFIDPDFCVGCCIIFYMLCVVAYAIGLAWIVYLYPNLIPPPRVG